MHCLSFVILCAMLSGSCTLDETETPADQSTTTVIADQASAKLAAKPPPETLSAEFLRADDEPPPGMPRECPNPDTRPLHLPDGDPPEILTRDDFERVMLAGGTPLDKLSPATLAELSESLYFNRHGLVSFMYAGIKEELTPADYDELLSLFGWDMSHDDDDPMVEYQCHSRGTCKYSHRYVCKPSKCADRRLPQPRPGHPMHGASR